MKLRGLVRPGKKTLTSFFLISIFVALLGSLCGKFNELLNYERWNNMNKV